MRSFRYAMCICFVVALVVPGIDTWAQVAPRGKWTAERPRAAVPGVRWTVKSLAKFPQRVDAFFDDNFGLRDQFIRWNNWVKVFGFGESPTSEVIIGRDGWLFYATVLAGVSEREALEPIPLERLEARRQELEARQARLAEHGSRYVFVVAPNKQTIYPELLPLSVRLRGQSRALDSFVDYMRKRSSVPVVDLRPALLAAKGSEPLYVANDSHWNGRGSLIGYREVMKHVTRWLPRVNVVKPSDVYFAQTPWPGDLAGMLGMPEEWPALQHSGKLKPAAQLPLAHRAVLVGDSFAWETATWLLRSFEHVAFYRSQEVGFDLQRVLQDRPDVVIEQHVERFVMAF